MFLTLTSGPLQTARERVGVYLQPAENMVPSPVSVVHS